MVEEKAIIGKQMYGEGMLVKEQREDTTLGNTQKQLASGGKHECD